MKVVSSVRQRFAISPRLMVLCVWLLACSLVNRTRAENRADYRYEYYAEEAGRIEVQTHGLYFASEVKPWLTLKGNFIYDGVSGATPLGPPPLPGESTVPTATIDEIRRAGFLESTFQVQNQAITPQIAYSTESDYQSTGISLNYAIELDEKNTVLAAGLSHSFDKLLPNVGAALTEPQNKDTTDVLLGITQILGSTTVFGANLTLGYASGYMNDPYKRVLFLDFPLPPPGLPYTVWPEARPGSKFRQVVLLSLQQYVEKLKGAADLTYRFHHDDFGIIANTATLQWNQKLGSRVIISPLFRFHTQTAADFYATAFPGDPTDPAAFPLPDYYSSDYRISALNTFTYGLAVTARLQEHISLSVAYQRYAMDGTDGVTAEDQYPTANVFSVGATLWW
jgi:hypothetical protein